MKKRLVFATLVSIIVSVNGVLSAAVGDSWDLRTDIAFAGNPNGQWTYGCFIHADRSLAPDSTAFTAFSRMAANHEGGILTAWYHDVNNWPYVGRAQVQGINFGVPYEEGQIGMHAGDWNTSVVAVARWTAPEAGQVSVDAEFIGGDVNGDKDYFVILNHTDVLLNQYAQGLENGSYAGVLAIQAGDTIDIAVGRGTNLPCSAVLVDATFTYVPEPLTVSLLGLGFLMYKRRRLW